ncbi:MAG: hypothetical protein ACTSQP_05695 [Promethearchaeota archaeon]
MEKSTGSNYYNTIEIKAFEFIDWVLNEGFNSIFKDHTDFFVLKEGYRVYTPHYRTSETFEEFINKIEKLKKGGFKKDDNYSEALQLGIYSLNEYQEFINSDFRNYRSYSSYINIYELKENYEKFLEARKMGFTSAKDYFNALEIGCNDATLFNEFKNSSFYKKNSWRDNEWRYKDFLKAKKLGFNDSQEYYDAMELGFKNPLTFKRFKESGCNNKEEFLKLIQVEKEFPNILRKKSEEISKLKKDAENALISKSEKEYIQINWLIVEKLAKLIYMRLYSTPEEEVEKIKLYNILGKIEKKTKREIINEDDLKKWMKIREKVVYDGIIINESTFNKTLTFFNTSISILEEILEKIKSSLK